MFLPLGATTGAPLKEIFGGDDLFSFLENIFS